MQIEVIEQRLLALHHQRQLDVWGLTRALQLAREGDREALAAAEQWLCASAQHRRIEEAGTRSAAADAACRAATDRLARALA